MKIYIYKGGLSLVAKSGVGSAIRHQGEDAASSKSDRDGRLERGGYRTDQYRIA